LALLRAPRARVRLPFGPALSLAGLSRDTFRRFVFAAGSAAFPVSIPALFLGVSNFMMPLSG
jgi:hypothetical protein